MIATPPQEGALSRVKSLQGIAFAAISALTAEGILSHFPGTAGYYPAFGRVAAVFLSIYVLHRFALASFKRYDSSSRDLLTLCAALVASIFIVGTGEVIAIGLATYTDTTFASMGLNANSLFFAIPFASGGLILQSVLGLHYGFVFAVAFAVIMGVYSPTQPILIPYVLATTLIGCLSLARFRSRAAYVRAGLNITVIALPFALASVIIEGNVATQDIVGRLVGAVLCGVLCSFIAAGVTPIAEYLGGYVTDMRLLEMATLDHPLLKSLSVQAPGTWNHSMVMGMMSEAAADAIGANPVLARVGAYFHDVGKIKKPLYFVENQLPGENRHDKLSPSMSALIIRSHVKDGIELSRKQKLPSIIEDLIPQHHGTSLIEFFYEKAKKEAKEEGSKEAPEIDKSLYSYPGPKPQTKEAGILMLADGIEAAARTLSEPTLDRIQGLVQKMINKVFASGQLNECELTLVDLHLIAKCFTRVLTGIYHQRVVYAEPAEKVAEKQSDRKPQEKKAAPKVVDGSNAGNGKDKKEVEGGGSERTENAEDKGQDRGGEKSKPEDLKRLGL